LQPSECLKRRRRPLASGEPAARRSRLAGPLIFGGNALADWRAPPIRGRSSVGVRKRGQWKKERSLLYVQKAREATHSEGFVPDGGAKIPLQRSSRAAERMKRKPNCCQIKFSKSPSREKWKIDFGKKL